MLSAITNLRELDKLMDQLDNLDILFFSLKKLDAHPVITAAANKSKTTPQEFLDKWLIEKFQAYKKQNEVMEQSRDVAQFIEGSSMNTILHYIRNHVMDAYKYADAILGRILGVDRTILVRHSQDRLIDKIIPLLTVDEVKEIIKQQPIPAQWCCIKWLLSSNKASHRSTCKKLSKEIIYPGTSRTIADITELIAEYGIGELNQDVSD